jgi:acyl-CoA reductase-like NAD-dependent aldehyde dehydrogenase
VSRLWPCLSVYRVGSDLGCCSWNHGQACCAGSRIFVQEGIYDKFLEGFIKKAKSIKLGDPFGEGIDQGPQVSQIQYDVSRL